MKDNFPAIADAWFIPSGGHFYFGIQEIRPLEIILIYHCE